MVKRIFNKRASRGMAVLMAAAMVGTMSPVSLPTQPTWMVQAATTTPTVAATDAKVTPSVSYVNEKLTITDSSSGADTFYYAIVTVKDFAEDNVKKYPKASAYEAVAKDDASDIDLSWANLTKDNTYLFVTTDPDVTKVKPKYVKLAKQNTKLKISFAGTAESSETAAKTAVGDADNGYLKLATDEKSNPDNITFEKMEYRTENGSSWTDVTDGTNGLGAKLKRYTAKGATLQLRVKAVDPSGSTATGNPAGKIFKVKVVAKAKAPKVTVNYLNQTVKFAKGTEYKVETGSSPTWVPATDADVKTGKTMTALGYGGTALKISVRTKAITKKASSKVTVVNLPASTSAPTATVAGENTVKPDETVNQISIDYAVPYDVDKGIQVTNNSDQPLQVAIIKKMDGVSAGSDIAQNKVDSIGIADKKKVSWTNVAAAKIEGEGDSKKVTKAGVAKIAKIDGKKISEVTAADYVIIYRLADKKATVISKITVKALPTKVTQLITVKDGETNITSNGSSFVEATGSADKILTVEFKNLVSDKSRYTVTAFKAKKDGDKYVADGSKVSVIKGTVADGKLTIQATAKAQGNYILNVKCEGAEFNVPVHVFKSTTATITADNTVSKVEINESDKAKLTAEIGKDKKSVVVTSKTKAESVTVKLTVANPTDSDPNGTKEVSKTVKIDADGNITVN